MFHPPIGSLNQNYKKNKTKQNKSPTLLNLNSSYKSRF